MTETRPALYVTVKQARRLVGWRLCSTYSGGGECSCQKKMAREVFGGHNAPCQLDAFMGLLLGDFLDADIRMKKCGLRLREFVAGLPPSQWPPQTPPEFHCVCRRRYSRSHGSLSMALRHRESGGSGCPERPCA